MWNQYLIYLVASLCALALITQIPPATSLGSRPTNTRKDVDNIYGPAFLNHSGCLYAYIGGGQFFMTTADEFKINETLDLDKLEFEQSKTRCVGRMQTGKLAFSFKFEKNDRINSLTVSMRIAPSTTGGYWDVSQANLTVTRADIERKRTFPLRAASIYASSDHSYSCNELKLVTSPKRKMDNETRADPFAMVILERFQLQPFGELKRHVFAESYDCSGWITIPGVMGLVLILFMLAVTVLGTILLKGIETNDFKFSKEGLRFTQSQLETHKIR